LFSSGLFIPKGDWEGFAMAARRVWAPTVTKARMKAAVPAATKTVIPNLLLTLYVSSMYYR